MSVFPALNNMNINNKQKSMSVLHKCKKPIENLQEQVDIFEKKTGREYNEYFEEYHPKLIYYITKICNDGDMAEDMALESFIVGLEKIDSYDSDKGKYNTWLFTIARNATLQEIKKRNRLISIDSRIGDGEACIKDFLTDSSENDSKDAESDYMTGVKFNITKKNIKKLKEPYKSVIELRELDNKSYKDIATEMGEDVNFTLTTKETNKVKLPDELSYVMSITEEQTNKTVDGCLFVEGGVNKTPFYTHVSLPKNTTYAINGRKPQNLSTIKSQIRNSRMLLNKMVKQDFKKVIEFYGD